jgi:hypothetical protein
MLELLNWVMFNIFPPLCFFVVALGVPFLMWWSSKPRRKNDR